MAKTWLKALNEGKIVGTVLVDFRKAFHLVDTNRIQNTNFIYSRKYNKINISYV